MPLRFFILIFFSWDTLISFAFDCCNYFGRMSFCLLLSHILAHLCSVSHWDCCGAFYLFRGKFLLSFSQTQTRLELVASHHPLVAILIFNIFCVFFSHLRRLFSPWITFTVPGHLLLCSFFIVPPLIGLPWCLFMKFQTSPQPCIVLRSQA